ncbi:terpene cyclase/mutase family protein [Risungbinella massiliensis]|uniref:terpene cyclase/mutase family protein n=1 Tax=Risungbinella massiliensis TaxID=1329796 RepID=UPI0005CBBD4A|nr:prenyltransferase/squalene oxidase repeat-containing protein [Risungbinella massiliensis]
MSKDTLEKLEDHIQTLSNELLSQQAIDGSWRFCFESGTMTDSYSLLLMKLLKKEHSKLQEEIIYRMIQKQSSDGLWRAFPDEKSGNVSATLESTIALLYTGALNSRDPSLQLAKEFIQNEGGIDQAGSLTKVILALLGHIDWPMITRIPISFLLLPNGSPASLYDFVGFARVHIVPIMIASHQNFTVRLPNKNMVDNWLPKKSLLPKKNSYHSPFHEKSIQYSLETVGIRDNIRRRSLRFGEQFLLNRIEQDGTLYSYMTTTFLMIFALLALQYPANHPIIQKAYRGILSFQFPTITGGKHIQETTSTVWDTSLLLHALQQAGITSKNPKIKSGIYYLLDRQQRKLGDWSIRNPGTTPGGWGFSDINTINPDLDDTTACLRALAPSVRRGKYKKEWSRGVNWVLSMQNRDGGWPAFEKNTYKHWQNIITPDGGDFLGDPSSADLTGRTLEFLGNHLGLRTNHPQIRKACNWLIQNQLQDGSWFGRWGITYIYGTWAALTGLRAVGESIQHPSIQKGIKWLHSIQNPDGGWGESCYSDVRKKYTPLDESTIVQTAWALDALIACSSKPTPAIEAGMRCLFSLLKKPKTSLSTTYPVGGGLAGLFYVYYHSYPYIWPLLTLTHYKQKYGDPA